MFQGSTDFLSYVLILFLTWIYIPTTLFRFAAEFFIDLGRRRDATQLEEVVSACLPGGLLVIQAHLLFGTLSLIWPAVFSYNLAVIASMFGANRGAVSDYIYAGNWIGCATFFVILWTLAILYGLWFGCRMKGVCRERAALHSIEQAVHEYLLDKTATRRLRLPERVLFRVWYGMFQESVVPLYPWREVDKNEIRLETKRGQVYKGNFIAYEKTTDGVIDAIRLENATLIPATPNDPAGDVLIKTFLVKWKEVVSMSVVAGGDSR